MASASLSPESNTPARSSSERARCSSSCARVVTRFLSCHFQSFQSSGATSGQQPGACETNSFPSPFSAAKVIILSCEKNVKIVNNRVNGGTEKCATNVLLRDGDAPANEFHSRGGCRFSQDTRPWSLDRDERADRNFGEELACRF